MVTDDGYIGYAVIANKSSGTGCRGHPGDARRRDERGQPLRERHRAKGERWRLEGINKSGKSEVIVFTDAQKALWKKALVARPQGKRIACRQGDAGGGLQEDRFQAVTPNQPRPIPSGHPRRDPRPLRGFPATYFREIDEKRGYPDAFVDALTKAGWLAALIPQDYGGSGLGLTEASVIMEEINRSGGNSGACHGQMYNMGTLLRHGSEAQKRAYLPKIASGELRLQSMAVTEPTTGTDTTKIKTTAVRKGDRYVVNGQKVWISRVLHSDLMILLARTTPLDQVEEALRRHVDLPRRPARGDRPRA